MSKLFKDNDSWGENSSSGGGGSFSFKKTPAKKATKKDKKALKRKLNEEIEASGVDSVGGSFVRAPQFYNQKEETSAESVPEKTKNKRKRKHEKNGSKGDQDGNDSTPEVPKKMKKPQEDDQSAKSFQDKLRENLKGSRFRFLNEIMYKQSGSQSLQLLKSDPTAFTAYHEGYRHQISKWPMNPLDRIINNIKRLPKNHVIADMGCGDARLSKAVVQKVYSLDLVSNVEGVIETDMAKTPLETNSVHVVVYCLSLMGTNLKDFFIEANRILKMGGLVKVAEVSSRFDKIDTFTDFVQKCGFELMSKDLTHNLFYFINFKKTHDVNAYNKVVPDYSLKPCLYKKR
ncbi:unnamed protein product [Diamesa hyperborea]